MCSVQIPFIRTKIAAQTILVGRSNARSLDEKVDKRTNERAREKTEPNETNIAPIWKCRRLFPINLRETVNYIFDGSVACHEMCACVRARSYLLRLFDIDVDIIMHVYAFTSSSVSSSFFASFSTA